MAAGFFVARQRAGEADGTSGKKRRGKSGVKGAATPSPGEAVSGKTDKTTIYRTKPE